MIYVDNSHSTLRSAIANISFSAYLQLAYVGCVEFECGVAGQFTFENDLGCNTDADIFC